MTTHNMTEIVPLPAPHKKNWRDWQHAQPPFQSPDPRFVLRLSSPEDFPEIYDLLNSTFGNNRSAAEYDWIYKKNPYGMPHCRLVIEKASGKIVSNGTRFPWPLARGSQDMEAIQGGDSATLPQFQRQGLLSLRIQHTDSHPWYDQAITFGLPNQASRNADKKYNRPVSSQPAAFARKIVDWRSLLVRKGMPDYLAKLAAPVATFVNRPSRRKQGGLRVAPIYHFYQEHQTLSLDYSRSENFWCPHGAQWMNWRYFSHPSKKYLAHGVYDGDELQAFSVIRLDRDSAMLMELIAPNNHLSQILLDQVEYVAAESGAKSIDFYGGKNWRQWPALKQQGYFMRPSNLYPNVTSNHCPEALLPENWQLLPGDSDVF